MATIYLNTDHTATFGVLKDEAGQPVDGADVTVRLLDKNHNEMEQLTPFPLTFLNAGEGNYTAHIPYDHGLKEKTVYYGRYTAEKSGIQRVWDGEFTVERGTL